ncbi:MAG: tryptophan synthase subunit beta, partial [Bacteroidales bacterium]
MTNYFADENGFFGQFGGTYIPEMLHHNIEELRQHYRSILDSESFQLEYRRLLKYYVGRPSPLYHAQRLSQVYNTQIFLKREDLNHTGSHKINNTIGQ